MYVTAADRIIDTLEQWGVKVIFGLPGEGISALLSAINRPGRDIRLVEVQSPVSASLMACGYAKYTGRLGVCLAPLGASGIHLLNGLYDARLDGQPVLAITTSPPQSQSGTFARKEVAFDRLFMDVAVYNTRLTDPAQVEAALSLACRTALLNAGVTHINIPNDVQKIKSEDQSIGNGFQVSPVPFQRLRPPPEGDLRSAVEILNNSDKIVILAGRGALESSAELQVLSDKIGAPVVKTLLGKGALGDDFRNSMGCLGPYGTPPARWVIEQCDTLLILGSSFPYLDHLPLPGKVRAIQIDVDPTRISLRYPVEIGIVGDNQRTLKEMLPMLMQHPKRTFLEAAQANWAEWEAEMERQSHDPLAAFRLDILAWELGKVLPNNALIASDTGQSAMYWARFVNVKDGQKHIISGNLASTGSALPYAMAGQVAYPERLSLALIDEASFASVMAEFATCVRYSLPVKVILFCKDSDPARNSSIDYLQFAKACGAVAFHLNTAGECQGVLREAFQTSGPVLIVAETVQDQVND